LSIDNEEVRTSQVKKLQQVRANRDEAKAAAALQALNELAAKSIENINNSDAKQNLV
jgi:methylmalonyl-CoA mutase